jgi:hypothetical protein
MAKQTLNRAWAHFLWQLVGVTVENCRAKPKQHAGDTRFCGFADIRVFLFNPEGDAIPFLHLKGNAIKLIGDNLHFDPKAEPGSGDRKGEFFPHWLPARVEARTVITMKLAALPEIQDMVQITRQQCPDVQAFEA